MIYKYCKTDGFDILLNARLKLKINDFNDPFELVYGADEKNIKNNIRKEFGSNPNNRVWKANYDQYVIPAILDKIFDELVSGTDKRTQYDNIRKLFGANPANITGKAQDDQAIINAILHEALQLLIYGVNKRDYVKNVLESIEHNNTNIQESSAYDKISTYKGIGKIWGVIDSNSGKIEYDQDLIINKIVQDKIRQFKTRQEYWRKKIGIICLSKLPNIIQMWAHYADNHKGIVVGFDETQLANNEEPLIEIDYTDKMVLLPYKPVQEHFEKVAKTKQTDWEYEKEVRLYAELKEKIEDGNYYLDIPPASITELYLGLRSNKSTKEIAKLIKQKKEYTHLKLYKMDRDKKAFELRRKELPV